MKKGLVLLVALAAALVSAEKKKVVVVGLPPDAIEELRRVSSELTIINGSPGAAHAVTAITADKPSADADRRALLQLMADADAFVGSPSREVIQASKKLKWVQIASAGVEPYLYPELVDSAIVMTNYRAIASPGIADHAIGMLLALTRKFTHFISVRPSEEWKRQPYDLLELEGKTAVVIGVGGIGSQVARRAHAFGMTVIGVDPKEMNPSPFVSRMVYPDRLDDVLPLADAVFVCAPDTPESRGMMGPRQFELMKRDSYFIAVSRGKLYSLDALVRALDSRKLAGAGVDVTDPEPLPKGHPLWKFENVVITPHIATQSDGERPRQLELLKENLARFAKGERLRNVVDKQKGY